MPLKLYNFKYIIKNGILKKNLKFNGVTVKPKDI